MIGKPQDDLTLRAAMYGVLFQSYADQVCAFLKFLETFLIFTLNRKLGMKVGFYTWNQEFLVLSPSMT